MGEGHIVALYRYEFLSSFDGLRESVRLVDMEGKRDETIPSAGDSRNHERWVKPKLVNKY